MEQRYERTEAELFAGIEGMGRELENRVTGDGSKRLKDQGEKDVASSAAEYGSTDHHEAFAASHLPEPPARTKCRDPLSLHAVKVPAPAQH